MDNIPLKMNPVFVANTPQQFILNRLLSVYTEKEAMIPHLDEVMLTLN